MIKKNSSILSVAGALCVVATAHAANLTIRDYVVYYKDQEVGSAVFKLTRFSNHDVSRAVDVFLRTSKGDLTVSVSMLADCDARMKNEKCKVWSGDQVILDTVMDYKPDGAILTDNLKLTSEAHGAPLGTTPYDKSMLWFVTRRPKIAESATGEGYFFLRGKWLPTCAIYIGDTTMKLGSKTVKAHRIQTQDGVDTYIDLYDDQGAPLRIQFDKDITIVRH
jgi:hypothetical protein